VQLRLQKGRTRNTNKANVGVQVGFAEINATELSPKQHPNRDSLDPFHYFRTEKIYLKITLKISMFLPPGKDPDVDPLGQSVSIDCRRTTEKPPKLQPQLLEEYI